MAIGGFRVGGDSNVDSGGDVNEGKQSIFFSLGVRFCLSGNRNGGFIPALNTDPRSSSTLRQVLGDLMRFLSINTRSTYRIIIIYKRGLNLQYVGQVKSAILQVLSIRFPVAMMRFQFPSQIGGGLF